MDEKSIDVSLETYKAQLEQVNNALLTQSDHHEAQELLQLKEDLLQLISLTEEALPPAQNPRTESCSEETSSNGMSSSKKKQQPTSALDDELTMFYSEMNAMSSSGDRSDIVSPLNTAGHNMNMNQSKLEKAPPSNNSVSDDEMAMFYAEVNKTIVGNERNNKSNPTCSSKYFENGVNGDTSEDGKTVGSFSYSTDLLNEKFLDSIEKLEDVSGVKCQAPFTTEWSGTQYHNAMIEKLPIKIQDQENDDIRAKVLFLNPVLQCMCPCSYYLEGNCKFKEDECRYSHGYIVSLYQLRPYSEPDYSLIMEGANCLAKFTDGIWKPGHVEKVKDSVYHIRFLHNNSVLPLELREVVPQAYHPGDTDILSFDSDEDIITEIVPCADPTSTSGTFDATSSLGVWEKYTNGIGSKLMKKMGYVDGQGLGKKSQGRLEPVPIVMLPPGKSLDHCMKLKAQKGIKSINDTVNAQESGQSSRRKKRACVFSFLNKTIGDNHSREKSNTKKVSWATQRPLWDKGG